MLLVTLLIKSKCFKINSTNMINCLFIGGLGMGEVLVIALVVLLLFGGKKIPELMKGLGSGVKSFKDGLNGVEDTTSKKEETKASAEEDK